MADNKVKYDIFISYRRSDGFATARLIYDRLTQLGYRVSFDMETLRSGDFNTQLYERIENSRDVIVIVSADALKFREKPEHDWLRLEVAHALKHKKNIIPVFLRDVVIPQKEDMPEDVAALVMKNGVTASEEHFDSAMNKLKRLLHSRRKIKHKLLLAVAGVFLLVLSGAGYYFYKNPVYPLTHSEKQEFNLIYSYLVQQMENVNLTEHYYNRLLNVARDAVLTGDVNDFKDEQSCFENYLKNMKKVKFQDEFVEMAQRSKVIDASDLKIFPQVYDNYMTFVSGKIDFVSSLVDPKNIMSKSDKLRLIEINRKFADVLSEELEIHFIALLYKVRSSSVADFKKMVVPQLTNLRYLSAPWPTNESDIATIFNRGNEQGKLLGNEESAILGKISQAKTVEEQNIREQLKKQGYSDEQINKLLQKIYDVSRRKAQLQATQARVNELKRKAREKFAPKADDNDAVLWNKMINLKQCSLPEDALDVLALIGKNQDKTVPEKVCRVAAKVLQHPQDLPFVHGVVVVFFEAPATSHAVLKPGDVIVKVNGKDCLSSKDFRGAEGVKYILYRLNEKGDFEKLASVVPENQPRTAVAELPF